MNSYNNSGNRSVHPNVFNLLGLAMRAGKVVSGEDGVLDAIRSSNARLVIISLDASENTKKKILDKCSFYQIDWLEFGDRTRLGHAIGKWERVVLAVTDPGFAKKMKTYFVD